MPSTVLEKSAASDVPLVVAGLPRHPIIRFPMEFRTHGLGVTRFLSMVTPKFFLSAVLANPPGFWIFLGIFMKEFSGNPSELLEASNEFAYYPGSHSDASAQEFLNKFPLPAIINALQAKEDYPGLENVLVDCLDRIFRTKYGASLIPHYMEFVEAGLLADSQKVRCLACKTVSGLLNTTDEAIAIQLVLQHGVYQLLLDCLINGDERVASAAMEAIKDLARFPKSMDIIFPSDNKETTNLGYLASKSSSLARVRILALIVKLFSISSSVASVVYNANLLQLLEAEVKSRKDTLVILSFLELLYEFAEVQHSTEFLSRTTVLHLLSSIISDEASDSILRARAMMITGRLLSRENALVYINKSSFETVVSAIDKRFDFLESQDADECECALEALGQIGLSNQGATLLLSGSNPATRHVIDAAFDTQQHNKQLAALHALANILGETRAETDLILNGDAEEILKRSIYEKASRTSKLTPSGLLLSILKQDSEIRVAGYRVLVGLVARPWCLVEVISRKEIVDIVADPYTETDKIGMEARHKCCQAIYKAFTSSPKLMGEPALAGIASKLEEAIARGPFLGRNKRLEAQPAVMTADRF